MSKKKINEKEIKKVSKKINTGVNEETSDFKRLLIILGIVVVVIIGVYFVSKLIVDKRKENSNNNEIITGKIDYDIVSVGTILNRPYDEYYVMVYNGEDTDAMYYSSLITAYQAKEKSLKIYYCDLSNTLNSKYISTSDKGNSNAKKTEEFSFGKVTLMKIKEGKITSYIENLDKIAEVLH